MSLPASSLRIALGAVLSIGVTNLSHAQDSTTPPQRLEIRVTGGELVPTGNQRHAIDNAKLTAAQVSGIGRLGLRVEVRDYVTGFKPLIGNGQSQARNDMVITAAVRINRNSSR
jgi:hypothetical protein